MKERGNQLGIEKILHSTTTKFLNNLHSFRNMPTTKNSYSSHTYNNSSSQNRKPTHSFRDLFCTNISLPNCHPSQELFQRSPRWKQDYTHLYCDIYIYSYIIYIYSI